LKYRSEKPRSSEWSYDGSLLAVTYESCVVVYETSIYVVLQTVMSPECTDPRAVHFVGAGGRNMLVSGESELVLWDIIEQNGELKSQLAQYAIYNHTCSVVALYY